MPHQFLRVKSEKGTAVRNKSLWKSFFLPPVELPDCQVSFASVSPSLADDVDTVAVVLTD